MSTLEAIKNAGLDDDLQALFKEFFKQDDVGAKKSLMGMIDKNGLQCPEVIRKVGALQRDEVLVPGIYKKFKDLNALLAKGGSEKKESPVVEVEEPEERGAVDDVNRSLQMRGTVRGVKSIVAEEKEKDVVEDEECSGVLTDSDEADIREKLRKEEERWRAKLADKEKKLREQRIKKNKKKATRLGLRADEAAKVAELKAEIAKFREVNKKLRAEVKVNNNKVKQLRTRIAEIRPERQPRAVSSGGNNKNPASSKVDKKELEAAVDVITYFLEENPASKSRNIKDNTGIDGVLYYAAISSMKEAGKVEQFGRGPSTNYKLVK